jgi:hypothetical protein
MLTKIVRGHAACTIRDIHLSFRAALQRSATVRQLARSVGPARQARRDICESKEFFA